MKLAVLVLAVLPALLNLAKSENAISDEALTRQARQANAEEMVQNILQWLQGVYKQNNRKARQGGSNVGYLPPAGQNADRPRPFQPPSSTLRPYRPPSTTYEPSGFPSSSGAPYSPSSAAPYPPSSQQYPDYSQSGYPVSGSPQPPFISPLPGNSDNTGSYQPGPSTPPFVSTGSSYQPSTSSPRPYVPPSTSEAAFRPNEQGYQPIPNKPPSFPNTVPQASTPGYSPSSSSPGYGSSTPGYGSSTSGPSQPDDDSHPPHIHAIDVQCAKDMMTINLEFNKVYNGIIYSKGFYSDPNCRYVQENSNQIKYSFTLSLNSCGTEFVNGFETQGQSYLENVLVLQNEVGIQEVWDTIRSVRCLWEGNLNKQLSVALSVGMLNQEVVTFSGDTAMASLDIQMGRGPFAQPANGLVKIGETMTLVISVTGDPGFDIQVRDCKARDSDSQNVVALTDEDGCILKPKLFGAFQKTRNTENTGASIIAYAFFNAFKFPDIMDLILECNVELCKVNCEMCPNPNQKLEPGKRRRRDTFSMSNETLSDPVMVGKGLRVVFPEDIAFSEPLGVCLSYAGFLWGAAFVMLVTVISSISAGCMWLKLQRHAQCKNHM